MRVGLHYLSCAALAAVGLSACGGASTTAAPSADSAAAPTLPVRLPHGVAARLPAGWHLLRKPITNVTYPVQALAATSHPAKPGKPRGNCQPEPVLGQKPPKGALVEVVEWANRSDQPGLRKFPPRPRPFRLPRHNYRGYECSGYSYNVPFRDHRRAFQVFVWLDPKRVDPEVRRQTIHLLNSLRFKAPAEPSRS